MDLAIAWMNALDIDGLLTEYECTDANQTIALGLWEYCNECGKCLHLEHTCCNRTIHIKLLHDVVKHNKPIPEELVKHMELCNVPIVKRKSDEQLAEEKRNRMLRIIVGMEGLSYST